METNDSVNDLLIKLRINGTLQDFRREIEKLIGESFDNNEMSKKEYHDLIDMIKDDYAMLRFALAAYE